MRSYLRLLYIILVILLFNVIENLLIVDAESVPESIIISTFKGDLIDDGHNETIQLKGNLLSQKENYYREVWVEVTSKYSGRWKIPFEGGYEPEVQILDLNHDHVNDLFYQSATNESDGFYSHHLYSLKNGAIKEIPLPKQAYIKGHFNNDYQVQIELSIKNNHKPILINVEDRANEYIELGLYNKKGTLLSPTDVIIAPISYYVPILISKSKGYGLMSYQTVSGAYKEDKLGTIETLWYYEKGSWIILNSDWLPFE